MNGGRVDEDCRNRWVEGSSPAACAAHPAVWCLPTRFSVQLLDEPKLAGARATEVRDPV